MSTRRREGTDSGPYTDETLQARFNEYAGEQDDVVSDLLQDSTTVFVMKMPRPDPTSTSQFGNTTAIHTNSLALEDIPTEQELDGPSARNLYDSIREQDLYTLRQTRDGTRVTYRDDLSDPILEFNATFKYEGNHDATEGYLSFAGSIIGDDTISTYLQ